MAEVSRKVLGWRLKAMPYLYTAFYDSHTFGCPIARPLWFNFPSDSTTLQLHEQWMMGEVQGPCSLSSMLHVCTAWISDRPGLEQSHWLFINVSSRSKGMTHREASECCSCQRAYDDICVECLSPCSLIKCGAVQAVQVHVDYWVPLLRSSFPGKSNTEHLWKAAASTFMQGLLCAGAGASAALLF